MIIYANYYEFIGGSAKGGIVVSCTDKPSNSGVVCR